MNTPVIIPVRLHTEQNYDVTIPETVYAYRNPREAKAIRTSSDDQHLLTPAARRNLALQLAANPSTIETNNYLQDYEQHWQIIREHPDVFLPKLENWLSTQSTVQELETGGKVALAFQNRDAIERANSETLRRLSKTPTTNILPLLRFLKEQEEDLRRHPGLAEIIVPYLRHSYAHRTTAQSLVYWLGAPEAEMRKHLQQLDSEDLVVRAQALHMLTYSPLLRDEAAGDAFISLVAAGAPRSVLYESAVNRNLFKNGELPWRERAIAELCKHPKIPVYYEIVCEFGGAAQAEYFVASLATATMRPRESAKDPRLAFNALTRIWDPDRALNALKEQFSENPYGLLPILVDALGEDAAPMILDAMDAENPKKRLHTEEVAGFLVDRKLCHNNMQILERLEKAFGDGLDDYYQSKQLLNDMCKLGFQRRNELVAKLPHYSEFRIAETHWILNDITHRDYADYLDQLQIGPAVDVDRILREIRDDDWFIRNDPDAFVRLALVQIGVATVIDWDQFQNANLDKMLLQFSSITQGDFGPIGAVVDPTNKQTVRISWNKMFFEIFFEETHSWYDPHAVVDVLNAIVDEYVDGDKRFVAYPSAHDGRDSTVAYLDKQVIEVLSERFRLIPLPIKAVPKKSP